MSSFPKVNVCLVAELIREEPRNKLSILGFYGTTPNMNIVVQDLPAVIGPLTFLLMCDVGQGQYKGTFRITDDEGETLVEAQELDFNLAGQLEAKATRVIIGFQQIEFKKQGTYKFELGIDGESHYETEFEVGVGPSRLFKT